MIPWLLAGILAVFIILILIQPSSVIDQYATQLRENYSVVLKNYKDVKYNKFPAAGRSVFVNAPFINLVSILLTKKNVTFLHITRVEELMEDEEIMKIQFEDILKPVSNEKLKFVLMEGEPGIGKSILVKELALRWAKQSDILLNQYKIVILIQLRFEIYQRAKDITDFFDNFENQNINMTELKLEVKKRKGEGILWILDGFDELPNHLRSNSIFIQLISGDIFPKSTVIVTSRPVASDPLLTFLHNHNSKRISLRGFDFDKSMEYASKYFSNSQVFSKFQAYYSSNLVIESMLYNPLNCYIVCTIFNDFIATNSTQYPRTMTALYNHYIRVLLKRHLLDVGIITDLDYNMPKQLIREIDFSNSVLANVWKDFSLLSEIAYDGVMKQKYIFGKDLHDVTKLSMMDTVVNFFAFDKDESSSFVHTTLQEYLAAVHIVNNKLNFTIIDYRILLDFEIVLTFYVGINKMIGREVDTTVLDILKQNMTIHNVDMYNIIGNLLIGCLYEDDSLVYKIHLSLDHEFRLESIFPTNFEIYISGYLTAVHNIRFSTSFYNSDNLKAFHKGLKSQSNINGELIVLLFVEDAYDRQRALEELLTMPSHVIRELVISPYYNLDMPAICKIITKFQLLEDILFYSDNFYCDSGSENPLLKLDKLNRLETPLNFPNKNVFETLKQLTAPGRPMRGLEIENYGSFYSNILNLITKDSSLEELIIDDSFDVFRHGAEIPSLDSIYDSEVVLQEIIWTKNTNNLKVDHYQKFIYNLELGKIQSTTQLSSFTSFMHVKIKKKWHYAKITVYSESGTSELTYFITAFNNCSLSLRRSTENVAKIKLEGKFTCFISSKEMYMYQKMHELAYYKGDRCLNEELNSMKKFIYNFLAVLPIPLLIKLKQIYPFKCLVDILFVVNCIFLVFRFIVSILYQSVLSVFGYNLVVILAVSISFYLIIVLRQ